MDAAEKKRGERHKEEREGSCHTAHYGQHVRHDIHSYVHVYVYVLYRFYVHDHVVYFFRCYCYYYYYYYYYYCYYLGYYAELLLIPACAVLGMRIRTNSSVAFAESVLELGLKLVLELELGPRTFVPLALCGGA